MKSILTASIFSVALAAAVPAMAQTHSHKMMHHHHGKNAMQGPNTKSKPAGAPTTADLNEQSLNNARGGMAPAAPGAAPAQPGTMAPPPPAGQMAPPPGPMAAPNGAMAPAGSGTPASATPTNAPSGS